MSERVSRSKWQMVFEYLLVSFVLFYSGHAIMATDESAIPSLIFRAMTMLAIVLLPFGKFHLRQSLSPTFWFCAIWIIITGLNTLVNPQTETWAGALSKIGYVMIAVLMMRYLTPQAFIDRFIKIMLVLAVISLVGFYILGNTSLITSLPVLRGTGEDGELYDKYQGFLLYYKADVLRNNGAFWEPGIFSSYLTMAMAFLPTTALKRKWIYYLVFAVTVLSTASSAGYILLFLVLAYVIVIQIDTQKSMTGKNVMLGAALIACAVVVLVFLNLEAVVDYFGLSNNSIFIKILNTSESSRTESIWWNLEQFAKAPIFGHGYIGLSQLPVPKDFHCLDTATSFRLLAVLGFGAAIYTVFIVRGIFRQKNVSVLSKMFWLLILLIIVNKEAHDSFLFMWLLIFFLNEDDHMLHQQTLTEKAAS